MSMFPLKPAMLMAGIMLMSFPALADQKAADGCAARLTKDAADIMPWSNHFGERPRARPRFASQVILAFGRYRLLAVMLLRLASTTRALALAPEEVAKIKPSDLNLSFTSAVS